MVVCLLPPGIVSLFLPLRLSTFFHSHPCVFVSFFVGVVALRKPFPVRWSHGTAAHLRWRLCSVSCCIACCRTVERCNEIVKFMTIFVECLSCVLFFLFSLFVHFYGAQQFLFVITGVLPAACKGFTRLHFCGGCHVVTNRPSADRDRGQHRGIGGIDGAGGLFVPRWRLGGGAWCFWNVVCIFVGFHFAFCPT